MLPHMGPIYFADSDIGMPHEFLYETTIGGLPLFDQRRHMLWVVSQQTLVYGHAYIGPIWDP